MLFRLIWIVFILVIVVGCYPAHPNLPHCRTQTPENANTQVVSKNTFNIPVDAKYAGCLIRLDQRVLLISHRLSDRLDIPGGMAQPTEALACAAHRETFAETGINVEVRDALQQTANGMVIFACVADNVVNPTFFPRTAPSFAQYEASELHLHDPYLLDKDMLRFADDLIPLRDAFVITPSSIPVTQINSVSE